MSQRSMLEFNHDYIPDRDPQWAEKLAAYLRSGDRRELPNGVTFLHRRHHSEDCPMESPVFPLLKLGDRFGSDGGKIILMKDGRRVRGGITLNLEVHSKELEPQLAGVLPAIVAMLNRGATIP